MSILHSANVRTNRREGVIVPVEKAGLGGRRRGQQAAALDAAGAGLGSIGLAAFAATFYALVATSVMGAFTAAILIWAVVSVPAWWLRRKLRITSP